MKDSVIESAVAEFARSNKSTFEKSFAIRGSTTEYITIKFERKNLQFANEMYKSEVRANTISAMPSGSQCSCCGGSGRS